MALIDVQHQPNAHRTVQRALASQRVPHAYLFHGPDGVGKELFAKGLAQTLLCTSPKSITESAGHAELPIPFRDACGSCEDCRAVTGNNHPDFHPIFRQLNRQHPDPTVRKRTGLELSVDVIRHFVIDAVGLTPIRGRAKVFVIREADCMTPQAQNALLKTLEEPPNRTYIILLSSSLDGLLSTTQSRCQIVRFDLLPTDFVAGVIERHISSKAEMPITATTDLSTKPQSAAKRSAKKGSEPATSKPLALSDQQIRWYAQIAQGSAGAALDYLAADLYSLNAHVAASLDRHLTAGNDELAKQWLEEAKSLSEFFSKQDPEISDSEATRRALKTVYFVAATYLNDLLHTMTGQQIGMTNPNNSAISNIANRFTRREIVDRVVRLALAERQLDQNANTQLILDCLAADLAPEVTTTPMR